MNILSTLFAIGKNLILGFKIADFPTKGDEETRTRDLWLDRLFQAPTLSYWDLATI